MINHYHSIVCCQGQGYMFNSDVVISPLLPFDPLPLSALVKEKKQKCLVAISFNTSSYQVMNVLVQQFLSLQEFYCKLCPSSIFTSLQLDFQFGLPWPCVILCGRNKVYYVHSYHDISLLLVEYGTDREIMTISSQCSFYV